MKLRQSASAREQDKVALRHICFKLEQSNVSEHPSGSEFEGDPERREISPDDAILKTGTEIYKPFIFNAVPRREYYSRWAIRLIAESSSAFLECLRRVGGCAAGTNGSEKSRGRLRPSNFHACRHPNAIADSRRLRSRTLLSGKIKKSRMRGRGPESR